MVAWKLRQGLLERIGPPSGQNDPEAGTRQAKTDRAADTRAGAGD
jgi:hypothetical protein